MFQDQCTPAQLAKVISHSSGPARPWLSQCAPRLGGQGHGAGASIPMREKDETMPHDTDQLLALVQRFADWAEEAALRWEANDVATAIQELLAAREDANAILGLANDQKDDVPPRRTLAPHVGHECEHSAVAYRWNDVVGFATENGPTTYLHPRLAQKLGEALLTLAADIYRAPIDEATAITITPMDED